MYDDAYRNVYSIRNGGEGWYEAYSTSWFYLYWPGSKDGAVVMMLHSTLKNLRVNPFNIIVVRPYIPMRVICTQPSAIRPYSTIDICPTPTSLPIPYSDGEDSSLGYPRGESLAADLIQLLPIVADSTTTRTQGKVIVILGEVNGSVCSNGQQHGCRCQVLVDSAHQRLIAGSGTPGGDRLSIVHVMRWRFVCDSIGEYVQASSSSSTNLKQVLPLPVRTCMRSSVKVGCFECKYWYRGTFVLVDWLPVRLMLTVACLRFTASSRLASADTCTGLSPTEVEESENVEERDGFLDQQSIGSRLR
ncbi:hypothetical protein CBL_09174 [Carabus blaptoides fortunei]